MRAVDTRFWIDGWVRKLNPLDRYVFLYFLTNPHSSWCGVYELDLTMAAFETGIEETELTRSILPRLLPKIVYIDGWVYIPNFEKYHTNHSEQTRKGIENAWKQVPERIRLQLKESGANGYPLVGASASSSSLSSSSSSTKKRENTVPKKPFGESKNVFLTEEEYTKLCSDLSQSVVHLLIEELDDYIGSKGARYASHYHTIRSWARRRITAHVEKVRSAKPKSI